MKASLKVARRLRGAVVVFRINVEVMDSIDEIEGEPPNLGREN